MSEPFCHRFRIEHSHIDGQGVVSNARYLGYCEEVGVLLQQEAGVWDRAEHWETMVKAAVLEWSSPARAGDELTICVGVSRWGTTSLDLSYTGRVGTRDVFHATLTHVGVDLDTGRPTTPPDDVKFALSRYGPPV